MLKKVSQATPVASTSHIVDAYSTSTTDGYSCNYINGAFEWKYLGSANGSNKINLPSSFNELEVYVYNAASEYYPIHIVKGMLTTSEKGFKNGHFIHATNNSGAVQVNCTNTQVWLSYCYLFGSNYTSSSTIYVYYR